MVQDLLQSLTQTSFQFSDVLAYIDQHYDYTPTAFRNGTQYNQAGENQGSAKVLAFAQLYQLKHEQTLSLFAEHYAGVLADPTGSSHQNIRQFIQHGWQGVEFSGSVLIAK
ncbi:HopJ type III effector protein [uncultured Acinetobacter sp.]|uniref:HopJ type III effector protein n=1 Tax=uncultured Acinetobacter sp. TaxID=165433 RepID=UPI002602AA9B|nr:HopJ type III effector protein [uncultured Acinetobacter sp.]